MSAKIDQLTDLLQRLNSGENPDRVKAEARDFLSTISPEDLSFAEQQLIDAGLAPEDLRHLCSAHIEALGDTVVRMKEVLPPQHPIATMIREHEQILGFLDDLEIVNRKIQQQSELEITDLEQLQHIAELLLGAEPHHQREERVLFLALEQSGVFGPPRVMRMEHEDLRQRKHALQELAMAAEPSDVKAFQKKLDAIAKFLILTLRDHIFKENNILYPTALQMISQPETWEQMKRECDRIGYCCFTPLPEVEQSQTRL